MKIYTKTGDKGQTSLANGRRVSKKDPRLEAYGTADELNSWVGLLHSRLDTPDYAEEREQLLWIQQKLFNMGALLAEAEGEWITIDDVHCLEGWIDMLQEQLPPLRAFVLPGGSERIAICHLCRTVTRRLERRILEIVEQKDTDENVPIQWVNRLSDYFFMLARRCSKKDDMESFLWKK